MMFSPSPERLQQMASKVDIDNEQVQEALLTIAEDKVRPEMSDIKKRAEKSPPREEVREQLESLSESEKDRLFHETWAELITACVQLRVEPLEGMRNLKPMIRDPWTVETVLMLFEDDEIPDDITEANKDLVSDYINWMGCAIAPEMYERESVEDMIEQFGADPALLDKWDEENFPDDPDEI